MHRLTIRIDFADGSALGPGKVRLLELVAETGSIRKAAAKMKMSYRRAWLLLQSLAQTFGQPLAETATGGRHGGGARLTARGKQVASAYRRLERTCAKAGEVQVATLSKLVAKAKSPPAATRRVRRHVREKARNPRKIAERKPA